MMEITKLYRDHAHEDYLKTHYNAVCFTENREVAINHGLGKNDSSKSEQKAKSKNPGHLITSMVQGHSILLGLLK
jgi:hypothetical protein